jgi:2-keto-3-deoxy-L-rhamnonate aldolase RhmA
MADHMPTNDTEIRPNRVKRKLADGDCVVVPGGIYTPEIIDMMGPLGFDGFWLEAEHGAVDFGDIGDLTRACDLWGTTSIVRINHAHAGLIYRTLDQGAQGIVVPHVNTAEEAQLIVDAAKFAPIGHRGMFSSRQAYGVDNFHAKANEQSLIVILIEDIVAVNNLAALLEIDHIDVYFVAPSDLGQSMGIIDPFSPEVQEVAEKAVRQIAASGRTAGSLTLPSFSDGRPNMSEIDRWLEAGSRFLHTPWMLWLQGGAKAYVEHANSLSMDLLRSER